MKGEINEDGSVNEMPHEEPKTEEMPIETFPAPWKPPKPPDFNAEYAARWKRFWPELRRQLRGEENSGPMRTAAADLRDDWMKLRAEPPPLAEGSSEQLVRDIGESTSEALHPQPDEQVGHRDAAPEGGGSSE